MENELTSALFTRWDLPGLLNIHHGLSVRPLVDHRLRISGCLSFSATARGCERINDEYKVDISVPSSFPDNPPVVRETAGRIPRRFHMNSDGSLCLGSATRLRLVLLLSPTLVTFIEQLLIPYLYGFSFYERKGFLPFGELGHGKKGLLADFSELFGIEGSDATLEMIRFTSMKRRLANKQLCPCGSGRRVGRCHNLKINALRSKLGRAWFRKQYGLLK